MTLAYKLVGYDRRTEFASATYDIPADKAADVRKAAGMNASEVTDWPLDAGQARIIAQIIGQRLDLDQLDFFLEPHAVAPEHA